MDNKPFQSSKKPAPSNRRNFKNVGFIALIVLFALIIFSAYGKPSNLKEIPLTQAIQQSNAGQYQKIQVNGNNLDITTKGGKQPTLKSFSDPNSSLKAEGF